MLKAKTMKFNSMRSSSENEVNPLNLPLFLTDIAVRRQFKPQGHEFRESLTSLPKIHRDEQWPTKAYTHSRQTRATNCFLDERKHIAQKIAAIFSSEKVRDVCETGLLTKNTNIFHACSSQI